MQFKQNPIAFITEASRLINEEKAAMLINNITYHKRHRTPTLMIYLLVNNFSGSLQEQRSGGAKTYIRLRKNRF